MSLVLKLIVLAQLKKKKEHFSNVLVTLPLCYENIIYACFKQSTDYIIISTLFEQILDTILKNNYLLTLLLLHF